MNLLMIVEVMEIKMLECFTIFADEIGGRIDPHFYRPAFIELEKKLSKQNHKPLGEVIEFSSETWNQIDFFDNEFPYIEISEIDTSTGKIQNITYYEKKQAPSRAKMIVRENDIIVSTTRPHRGAIASIDKTKDGYIASTGFAILRNLKIELNKKYLLFMLRTQLSLKQMLQRSSGGNYPAIPSEELKKIIIPLPTLPVQNKIIKLMEDAYFNNQENETQANQLLNSINNYVLDELGIKLPELKDKMCFVVNYGKIQKGRIDPIRFANPQDTLNSNKFKEKNLNEVASLVKGQSITKENITSGEYPVIAGGQSSPYSINVYNYKGNIITVSASGAYSGYVWYHDKPIFASDCTVIKSLKESEISTFYLYCVVKAKQQFIYNMQQGAGQPHVYSKDLSKLKIPLPSLPIQNKLAEEVKKRMQKAEQLQKEAKEELEKVKQEVERIILG